VKTLWKTKPKNDTRKHQKTTPRFLGLGKISGFLTRRGLFWGSLVWGPRFRTWKNFRVFPGRGLGLGFGMEHLLMTLSVYFALYNTSLMFH
jgi:hypothetical protein